jgi:ubiquinone/menaquinone biosynthesis C-methylase UbiE
MNRSITNKIRWALDELLPPIVRDNRYIMLPLFYLVYKGMNVNFYMDFKKHAYSLTEKEFSDAYENMSSIGTDRATDMNQESMNFVLSNYDKTAKTMLDVGCGRGYWLDLVGEKTSLKLTGVDVLNEVELKSANYIKGNMEKLPFKDNSFDIVFTSHTVEHVRNLSKSMDELCRVARKQVIIITPRQRFYNYTFDMHLNFFPTKEFLQRDMKMKNPTIVDLGGDWVYLASPRL